MARPTLLERLGSELDLPVFGAGVGLVCLFVVVLVGWPDRLESELADLNTTILQTFGSVYQATVLLAVVFALVVLVGPWGKTRLGGPDADPVVDIWTYFAMIFAAGIAAGVVFWGPSEAIFHYDSVPPVVDAQQRSAGAAVGALQVTIFHWGLSAWSVYLAVGLPIAYFVYERGAPLRVSAILTPFLGADGVDGVAGKAVDTLAVVATLGGMTATIGLVSEQFLAGLEYRWDITLGNVALVVLLLALVLVFTTSVVTGLHRGIRRLSVVTVLGALLLGAFTFALGPTAFVLEVGSAATVGYVREFAAMSTVTGGEWAGTWTLYYWSWWLSWAPFVGLFIARISRGRTIREVVLAGVFAPTAATTAWFGVLGGTSIGLQRDATRDILGVVAQAGIAGAAFPLFDALVAGDALILVFLALILVFLVTSADSSTLSIAFLTTRAGVDPSTRVKVVWGSIQAILASIVILAGGGNLLRSAAVLTGAPIAIVALLGIVGTVVALEPLQRLREWRADAADS